MVCLRTFLFPQVFLRQVFFALYGSYSETSTVQHAECPQAAEVSIGKAQHEPQKVSATSITMRQGGPTKKVDATRREHP